MDALSGITGFCLTFLAATAFSELQGTEKIQVLGLEIRTRVATIVLFGILCGLIFNLVRLLSILSYLISQLDASQNMEKAILILHTHRWVFNPFAQTSGSFTFLIDNFGFALLLVVWWLGFHIAYLVLKHSNSSSLIAVWTLFLFYLLFGLIAMIFIMFLIKQINPETMLIKFSLLVLFIPIGAFGIGKILKNLLEISNECSEV